MSHNITTPIRYSGPFHYIPLTFFLRAGTHNKNWWISHILRLSQIRFYIYKNVQHLATQKHINTKIPTTLCIYYTANHLTQNAQNKKKSFFVHIGYHNLYYTTYIIHRGNLITYTTLYYTTYSTKSYFSSPPSKKAFHYLKTSSSFTNHHNPSQ